MLSHFKHKMKIYTHRPHNLTKITIEILTIVMQKLTFIHSHTLFLKCILHMVLFHKVVS